MERLARGEPADSTYFDPSIRDTEWDLREKEMEKTHALNEWEYASVDE